jgi:hypothetical protein
MVLFFLKHSSIPDLRSTLKSRLVAEGWWGFFHLPISGFEPRTFSWSLGVPGTEYQKAHTGTWLQPWAKLLKNVSVAKVLKKILILGQSFNKNSNLGHVREIYPNLKPIC